MQPTIGRVVHYKLSQDDVEEIDHKIPRVGGAAPGEPDRNSVVPGETYPAVIVRVFDSTPDDPGEWPCNLQVLLDGDCQYWATTKYEGDAPGQWFWPPRV